MKISFKRRRQNRVSHRIYSYLLGWEWHILQHTTPQSMIKECPEAANWILQLEDNHNHGILISQLDSNEIVVQGTLSILLSDDRDDVHPLHFWISQSKLITIHHDNRIPIRLQHLNHTAAYEKCETAPEAFCMMINVLLEHLHISLDQFQTKLGELEVNVRHHNRKDLLDDIIERRYELLHFSHLYLPYRELEGIIKEAFLEQIEQTKSFIRLQHRFDRLDTLLKHYSIEIDTLLSVDDAISSMKGNEIIRTLTIFTVLCLPATILGSIWGSNFEWLPFKNEPLGFIYLILSIFIITAFLSFILWKKGWTGDIILSDKHKRKAKKLAAANDHAAKTAQQELDMKPLPPRQKRKQRLQDKAPLSLRTLEHQVIDSLPKRSKKHK